MSVVERPLPRLRQAVLAASDLESVSSLLREQLELGEPFSDPAVAAFGLENRVFALGDTFLEVVSPMREGTAAGRWLARRGADSGYMVMFEIDDFATARGRATDRRIREVFEVELEDMAEVHLHPADMRGAIVALSMPRPPGSWRWGGPGWEERSRPLQLAGATIATSDPEHASELWSGLLGAAADTTGVHFRADGEDAGLVELVIAASDSRDPLQVGGIRLTFAEPEAL